MLYVEYHDLKLKYNEAKSDYENKLEEKAKLFYDTQPKAVRPKEIVNHISITSDKYLDYCVKIEVVDIEVENARNLLGVREYRLKLKEMELRESKEILDIVYAMKFIDKMKVKHIARKMIYSYQRIYQLLDEINENIRKN
jgi:hypothetical protein